MKGLTNVIKIAGGDAHTIALKSDGTVWAWGSNYEGQLGDGTGLNKGTPVQVSGLANVIEIASGSAHSIAIKSDNTVWIWGSNAVGQLGDGSVTKSLAPIQVSGVTNVIKVAGGYSHTIALKSDGTVLAWGRNTEGELGDGTTTMRLTPISVKGLTNVTKIACGMYYTIALKSDGTVRTWGYNNVGQLGDGTIITRLTPNPVSGLAGVTDISGGAYHTIALVSGAPTPTSGPVHNINKGTNYTTIQAAINDASPGDEIHVDSGMYYENVNVTKRLILRGIGRPVVNASGSGSAITLAAEGITLEGFTATGGRSGIQVSSNNNTVKWNNANSNYRGGIDMSSSSNNTVSGNNASNNSWGIGLVEFSSNNTLSGNNANSNTIYGIVLGYSSNNMLTNNTMNANKYNFILVGDCTSCFNNQIDTTNLVDGKPVYYIKGASDKVYDSSTNAGTFYCINCVNVTLNNIELINNGYGIFFINTTRSTIQNVNVSKNIYGIYLLYYSNNNRLLGINALNNNEGGISLSYYSNNNTISGNNASNIGIGIYLSSSSNNNLYQNNLIKNTNQAVDNTNANFWNSTYPSGGNYWSDYIGGDNFSGPSQNLSGSDGIGDMPYNIGGGAGAQDRYPLFRDLIILYHLREINDIPIVELK